MLFRSIQMQIFGADAIKGRQAAHEHEVQAFVSEGLLDHQLIGRRLDNAQQAGIALGIGAGFTDVALGKGVTACAVMNAVYGLAECASELGCALAVMLHEVISDALRRLGSDAGQAAQRLAQKLQTGGGFHAKQKNSERQFEARRQRQAGRHARHFFASGGFGLAHGIIESGSNEIFEHVFIVTKQ